MGSNPHVTLHEMTKQYGPIISGRFGSKIKVIIIHDADIVESVFVQQGQRINSRLNMHIGAVFSYGTAPPHIT
jgi:hypothetical protein